MECRGKLKIDIFITPNDKKKIYSISGYGNFATKSPKFSEIFPNIEAKFATLDFHFKIPFFRELLLSHGMLSVKSSSIAHCLNSSNGTAVVIAVGGSEEAFHASPENYKFVVKNRKGFVKVALKTGSSLVPVISFGENEIFESVRNKFLTIVQRSFKNLFGVVLPFVKITEYFPLIPKRHPITTVVGTPINLTKIISPTQQDIDDLHQIFLVELEKLFNQHKSKYLKNHENINLEFL